MRRCNRAPVLLDLICIIRPLSMRRSAATSIRRRSSGRREEIFERITVTNPTMGQKGGELPHTMDAESNFCAKLSHRCVAIGTLTVKPTSPLRSAREKKSRLARKSSCNSSQRMKQKLTEWNRKCQSQKSQREWPTCVRFFCQSGCLCVPQFVFSPPT